jgi:hypothetical protein
MPNAIVSLVSHNAVDGGKILVAEKSVNQLNCSAKNDSQVGKPCGNNMRDIFQVLPNTAYKPQLLKD